MDIEFAGPQTARSHRSGVLTNSAVGPLDGVALPLPMEGPDPLHSLYLNPVALAVHAA